MKKLKEIDSNKIKIAFVTSELEKIRDAQTILGEINSENPEIILSRQ